MDPKQRQEYMENFKFPYVDLYTKYEKIAKIGQGTFGEVFKAREKAEPTKLVAMKRIPMNFEQKGFPITALRELRILQSLKHQNVVRLIEICRTQPAEKHGSMSTFYLIIEYCDYDLSSLISNSNVKLSLGIIKGILKQILNGLYFIHCNKVLHRDLKPPNILINKSGIVKLADFGLARSFSIHKDGSANRYTLNVVTLWYRPPELFLGDNNYKTAVDMWSLGCIMAEMWTRFPIIQGDSEQNQLLLIIRLCGSITQENWPNADYLPYYNCIELPRFERRRLREALAPHIRYPLALDLLDKLLMLDPSRRISADDALNHDFFWTDPMPSELNELLRTFVQAKPATVTSATVTSAAVSSSQYQDRIY